VFDGVSTKKVPERVRFLNVAGTNISHSSSVVGVKPVNGLGLGVPGLALGVTGPVLTTHAFQLTSVLDISMVL
jgi:hypothetical protein